MTPRLLSAAVLMPTLVLFAAAQEPAKKDPPKEGKTIKAPDGWVFHTNKDKLTTYLLPKERKGSASSEGSMSKDGLTGKTQVTSYELTDGRELTVIIVKLGGPKLKELKVGDVHDMAYEADQEPGAKLSEPADFKVSERLSGKEYYVTKRGEAMRVVALVTRDARLSSWW
ncbi:MAG: hypothetical protein U0871_06300 [Gemmataceae bacterium]